MTGEQQGDPFVGTTTDSPVDLRVVLAEIDQEVRAKRASGELPEDFERQLDRSFARFAPVDAVSGNFSTLLSKLEESTTIDTRAPTTSSRPGVAQVKAAVAKAIDWDLRHLSSQVSGLTHALTRALGLLGERVEALERDAPPTLDQAISELGLEAGRSAMPEGRWSEVALEALAGVDGRVLHAECGRGELVATLQSAGFDAYGVEPDRSVVGESEVADIRHDSARDHLHLLAAASPQSGVLGAIVLSGCVDRMAPGALLELIDLARLRLVPGGRLLVVSHHPRAWAARGGVAADLSGGHPWHPRTWDEVLRAKSFTRVGIVNEESSGRRFNRTGRAEDEAEQLDSVIDALNAVAAEVWGPAGFAVSATR